MTSQVVRIALRYLAMFLAAKGYFSPEDGNMLADDPDLAMVIEIGAGFAIGVLTEWWFWLAEKWKARKADVPFTGEHV